MNRLPAAGDYVILQRYLTREILHVFAAVFVLLLLIFISRSLVNYLSEAAAGKISADAILTLVGLIVLQSLTLLVPLCFFVSILMALGRMQRDNEIIAIAGAGLGASFLQSTVRRFAIIVALVLAVMSLFSNPWATYKMKELEAHAQEESDISGISPGRFKEFSNGDRVLFVEKMSDDKQTMENVFLQNHDQNKEAVLAADRAYLAVEDKTGNRFVVFNHGTRYDGTPGRADYEVTQYEKFGVRIERDDKDQGVESSKAVPTAELISGSDNPLYQAELEWRISTPISVLLLSALAVVLARQAGRTNRYGVILTGILLYFTYSNLLGISRSILKRGDLSPYIGLWWVHVLLLGLILFLEFKSSWVRKPKTGRAG
ncbi:MAG TPA: LPS export ABC transporter permease LptF [Gammaproteobacteria bacterium]|nr:LPS export ABC transporter permease LptF [Gammaproteobacteria bacterium]